MTPRKRLDVARPRVRATGTAAGTTLVIAGNDMGGLDEAIALARALGVADRVRVVGLLPGRERLEALADADAVVYPSEHEIFGLVPLEALLCGTPVVVADDSGCARGRSGRLEAARLLPVGDVEALAAAIARDAGRPRVVALRRPRARQRSCARATAVPTVCAELEDDVRGDGGVSVRMAGVSVVVPVHNGAATIRETLGAIARAARRPAMRRSSSSTMAARRVAGDRRRRWRAPLPLAIVDGRGTRCRRRDQRGILRRAVSRSSARSIRTW